MSTYDIVVAGAGHNSLITAAYLAKAGQRCIVLDARSVPGGGAATEEVLLPGYRVDTCASGHSMLLSNPVIAGDELGLVAQHGLRYAKPDPTAIVRFPDGAQLTHWLDLERTCDEISRFSRGDARAYRLMLAEWKEVAPCFAAHRLTPIGFGPSLDERLERHPRGQIWRRRNAMSAWEVIDRTFESRHMRAFMAWQAQQTLVPVDTPGSGTLPYSILAGRQRNSWAIPLGGSSRLVDALVAFLQQRGSTVLCDARVSELLLDDDGRCIGVRIDGGESFFARRAVVSTIHVKHLVDLAPPEAWGDEFLYGVETYDVGGAVMASYYAVKEAPFVETAQGPRAVVAAATVGWAEDLLDAGHALRMGRFLDDPPWLLVATPSVIDPSRVPIEGHHVVKLLHQASWALPDGVESWDEFKAGFAARQLTRARRLVPSLTDANILARQTKSPLDFHRSNPHMIHGSIHGGDRSPAFTGALRPVPGWAQHRLPIPGLYQTGGTTHPGGSITGAPGRNAAMVMLDDLGFDADRMLGERPGE